MHDLRALGAKIDKLTNPVLADWWRFTLITGLRRTSALTVRWRDVDALREGWLLIPEPKGGPRRAFELPITTQMRTILNRQTRVGEFVFAGNRRVNKGERDANGSHLVTPNKPGLPAIHQLRATWATRAAEINCPILVIKRLLNHSSKDDVTFSYVTVSDAVLAEWAQKIADSLWADLS
ncbi:MAG: tyrosine-type recombinase/integrase [Parvularculaceae bacterium]